MTDSAVRDTEGGDPVLPVAKTLGAALAVTLALGCGARRLTAPAPAAEPAPSTALRRVPLGLCEDYPEETRSLEEVRRDLEVLKGAGLDVLRVSIGWDGVEPQKDHYDFAFWDAFVDLSVRSGIRLIPYVAYTPRWDSDGTPESFWKTPPRDVGEFGEIMGLLAARYRGRIRSWEIWNEPDNRDFWLGSTAEYASLLAAGSAAVKRANPEAEVVSGGLAGHVEFLRELFERHGGDHVDVVNLHAYYETWNPSPLEALPRYLDDVSAIVERHGRKQAIWLAEVGYSDWRMPGPAAGPRYEHTLDYQAVMLVRTLALAFAHPAVSLVAWYELKDPRASAPMIGDDHNRHLGVTFADYSPKPAWSALAWAQATFGAGFRAVGDRLRVSRQPSSAIELRGFVTARGVLVVIAWLPTRAAPGTGVRRDRVRVTAPYLRRGAARTYDERGHAARANLQELDGDGVDFTLELTDGEVRIVEQPITMPR
jgi:hypothetical protein